MEEELEAIKRAESALNRAHSSGKVDRASITRTAQLEAAEAVAMVGVAMESDEVADEAARIAAVAAQASDRTQAKAARKKAKEARKKAKADHEKATKSAKIAYEAVKYSDPSKLGAIRVVEVIFALHIATTLAALILTSRDTVVYSSVNILDWTMVILEGVALWFIVNRYKVGRPFVVIMAFAGLASRIVIDIVNGTFMPVTALFDSAYYLFLIGYFAFSDRAKKTLVNDLGDKRLLDVDEAAIERRGWPLVRNLVIYFVVFSVLGHWMEAAMCQLIRLGLVQGEYDPSNTMLWRDWLFPFPMEGLAVVLIALVLYPFFIYLKGKFQSRFAPYAISFLVNMLTCTVIEFVSGLIFNADLQHWDYTNNFCNIMGQVCLQNALAFGAAASIIAWVVYPLLERALARVSDTVMNIVFVVVAITGGILFSLYTIMPPEGMDLGGRSAASQESQIQDAEVLGLMAVAESSPDNLQKELDKSKELTEAERAEIQKHIDNLRSEYAALSSTAQELANDSPEGQEEASSASSASSSAPAS